MAGRWLDPQIGLALSAIHRDTGHDWTVEELAHACSLSRSAFAARVGKPPATYLAHVRLDAATDLLSETSLPVTLIGGNVGYTSEAAFSRAFKRRRCAPGSLATRQAGKGRVSRLTGGVGGTWVHAVRVRLVVSPDIS